MTCKFCPSTNVTVQTFPGADVVDCHDCGRSHMVDRPLVFTETNCPGYCDNCGRRRMRGFHDAGLRCNPRIVLDHQLLGMNVPIERKCDIRWLNRNLPINNRGWSNLPIAMAAVRAILKEESR